MLVQQRLEVEEDAGALERRRFGPGGEGGLGGADGQRHVFIGGQRNRGHDFAGGGIEAVGVAAAAALVGLAVDEMRDLLHGCKARSGFLQNARGRPFRPPAVQVGTVARAKPRDLFQDLADLVEDLADLGLVDDQGRRDGDDIAGVANHEAAVEALLEHFRSARAGRGARASSMPATRPMLRTSMTCGAPERMRGFLEGAGQLAGAAEQVVASIDVQRRQDGGGGQRVRRIGVAVEELDAALRVLTMASCTSRLTATAPAGMAALLTPLAMVIRSGVTPK